jgi:hypothetical protein
LDEYGRCYNGLETITDDVIEAAASILVIGD